MVLSSDEDGSSQVEPELTSTPPDSQGHESRRQEPRGVSVVAANKPLSRSSRPFGTKVPPQSSPKKPKSQQQSEAHPSKVKAKPKPRTIHSFFNAATQRQQEQARGSSSPEKPAKVESIHDDEEDLISDDSIGEELGRLADEQSQSSFAIALRKRSRNAFEQNTSTTSFPSGSQKFRKASDGTKAPSLPDAPLPRLVPDDPRPWAEKYAPNNLEELAVHKKKVADVRSWLESVFSGKGRQRLLVLKGAAGTGKTTTMLLLAKEMGFDISEWRNPARVESMDQDTISVASQFEDFIGRSGKFQTLQFQSDSRRHHPQSDDQERSKRNQVILVEEYPNTFTRSSTAVQRFRSIILQYLAANVPSSHAQFLAVSNRNAPVTPLVMIISETSLSAESFTDSFTAHRLLGPEVTAHPAVTVLEFNAVAPTFLTKALELIVLKEARKSGRRQTPGPQVIKQLGEVGDIRSAISTLEFLCLRGDEKENVWSGKVTFTKTKASTKKTTPLSKMEEDSLAIITQRESTLGIFHSVGKVVYNKRDTADTPPQPPAHLAHAFRPKAAETNPDVLFNEMGTDCSTFVAALHENYILSCSGSDPEHTQASMNGCIDALSDADILSPDRFGAHRALRGSTTDSLRQEEISFQVSVRGILFSLPFPVKRLQVPGAGRTDAFKMMYPMSIKLWRQRSETEEKLDILTAKAQRGLFLLDDKPSRPEGVESWRRNRSDANYTSPSTSRPSQPGIVENSPPLLASGNSARHELLIERLPYMSMILRQQGSHSSILRDIEKITKFDGVGPQNDDIPGDSDEEINAKNFSHRTFGANEQGNSTASGLTDVGVQGLVLSDDDIEDD